MMSFLLASVLFTAPEASLEASHTRRFTLDPNRRVYSIGLAYETATSVWTDVGCAEPAIGTPDIFAATHPPREPGAGRFGLKRFMLTPLVRQPGAFTTYTFECAQGIRIVLEVSQVPREAAVYSVEFVSDPGTQSRIEHVRQETEAEATKACEAKLQAHNEASVIENEQAILQRLATQFMTNDDVERTREDFVRFKSTHQLTLGERAYLLFELKNGSGRTVYIKNVSAELEDGTPLPSQMSTFERKLPHAEKISGALSFALPTKRPGSVVLVARTEDGRELKLDDVDL